MEGLQAEEHLLFNQLHKTKISDLSGNKRDIAQYVRFVN